ncbi:uncharacterized protein EI90DRAFT_68890 [Cantharellus anzutake]|uniref:uncharacterized protein n=1 Tax=Cantharellus anzutake TaxID=1750568 RepID=UPI0019068E95|nr:uncharacterized protein EI90DRAFT_68890 [Cantharellus anzutake]KAF8344325.1 hypothetical protein EI90DRAFT_68890 [Cantharellus anzutake]
MYFFFLFFVSLNFDAIRSATHDHLLSNPYMGSSSQTYHCRSTNLESPLSPFRSPFEQPSPPLSGARALYLFKSSALCQSNELPLIVNVGLVCCVSP